MNSKTFPYLLAALGAAVALAACTDGGTAPTRASAAMYVLVSANDQPAPALVHDKIWPDDNEHTQLFVTADTIVLTADGRYTQHAVLLAYSNGSYVGRTDRRDHGIVARSGPALHFDSNFIQNVSFDGSADEQGTLSVVQDLPLEGTTARYVLRRN